MKKCSCSIGRSVLTNSLFDSIVCNGIESNWVTELYTLQCLGEENTLPNASALLQYTGEELLMHAQLVGVYLPIVGLTP